MPLPVISKPTYPNVPVFAGIPAIVRGPALTNPYAVALLGVANEYVWSLFQNAPQWGIFMPGTATLALMPDSFGTFDGRVEWTVADFPVEQGSFASYNKVRKPFDSAITLFKGGTVEERTAFLNTLSGMADDVTTYDIVTPIRVYQNATITGWRISHAQARFPNQIAVDILFQEVRQVQLTFSTQNVAKQPTAAPTANVGKVQPQPSNQSILSKIQTKLSGLLSQGVN